MEATTSFKVFLVPFNFLEYGDEVVSEDGKIGIITRLARWNLDTITHMGHVAAITQNGEVFELGGPIKTQRYVVITMIDAENSARTRNHPHNWENISVTEHEVVDLTEAVKLDRSGRD